jgi:hypothetical protein
MALRFKLQVLVVADDDQQVSVEDLIVLDKEHERSEQLGLMLAEAKTLLLELQRQVLSRQVAAFLASRTPCPACGRSRGLKDHKTIVFRTVFGKLELASPRLRRCPCRHSGRASISPLVELLPEHTAVWFSYGVCRDTISAAPVVGLDQQQQGEAEHQLHARTQK